MPRKKRVGRPPKARRAVRGLANIPTSKLREELERRSRSVVHLQSNREQLLAQLAEIENELSQFGEMLGAAHAAGVRRGPGRPPGRRGPGRPPGRPGRPAGTGTRRRERNEMSLVDALAATLRGKTMGVSEVAEEVQKNGYKTTSPNFRTIVNQALISNPKVFRKVSRGQYTAK